MLDRAVRARDDKALVPVREPDQVRRRTVLTPDLDDLGDPIRIANRVAVHMETVAHDCLHVLTMPQGRPAAPEHRELFASGPLGKDGLGQDHPGR
jgi:hypothetical protein